MAKLMFWKCKPIFPTDTLQQNIEITDLKPFLASENTSNNFGNTTNNFGHHRMSTYQQHLIIHIFPCLWSI